MRNAFGPYLRYFHGIAWKADKNHNKSQSRTPIYWSKFKTGIPCMQSITITIGPKKYQNQFDHVFKTEMEL